MQKVLGIRPYSFTDKDGIKVAGLSLYLGSEIPEGKGEGLETEKISLSSRKVDELGVDIIQVGDLIEVSYNRFGSVSVIRVC